MRRGVKRGSVSILLLFWGNEGVYFEPLRSGASGCWSFQASELEAYVGLTPSQYSSAEKIRMGRITGGGKNRLRALLVEASWTLITKDRVMREKYDRIKARAGAKRAIVAIARTLLLRLRRILLDDCPYGWGVIN